MLFCPCVAIIIAAAIKKDCSYRKSGIRLHRWRFRTQSHERKKQIFMFYSHFYFLPFQIQIYKTQEKCLQKCLKLMTSTQLAAQKRNFGSFVRNCIILAVQYYNMSTIFCPRLNVHTLIFANVCFSSFSPGCLSYEKARILISENYTHKLITLEHF